MHFCIVGTGRCGTTLLRNIFNSHPDIYVFNETHWIIKMYEKFGTGKADPDELIHILNSTYHITGELVTPLTKKNIKSLLNNDQEITVKEFCDKIGNFYAQKNGKIYWADKTPDYGPFMNILQKLWPKCKFIHSIRHGEDVAVSMSKHPGYRWLAAAREDSWVPVSYNKYYQSVAGKKRPVQEFGDLWYRRLKRIQNESGFLARNSYKEVLFEKLIEDPERLLISLSNFLNISASEKWIVSAVASIDSDRFKDRDHKTNFLDKKHISLLKELGYL